jgi:hypothetical protein
MSRQKIYTKTDYVNFDLMTFCDLELGGRDAGVAHEPSS